MPAHDPILDIGITNRKKVLVAEDEPNIASLIEDWLSDTYEVVVCYNGTSALQKAKWHKPHIILLDIVMPDVGGYEVSRALQTDPETSNIPVIAMTAKNYDDSTVKLIRGEKNVYGFINKPFRPDDLKRQIEQVMGGQRTFSTPISPPPSPQSPMTGAPSIVTMPSSPPPRSPMAPPVSPKIPAPTPPFVKPPQKPLPNNEDNLIDISANMGPEIELNTAEPVPGSVVTGRNISSPEVPLIVPPGSAFPKAHQSEQKGEFQERHAITDDFPTERAGFASVLFWVFSIGVLSLAMFLVTAEFVTRWTCATLGKDFFLPPVRPEKIDTIPYKFLSGASWEHDGVSYECNPWGLRDRDISLITEPDVYRIFLLGGTSVFGQGIPAEKTVAKVLESYLMQDQPFSAKTRYEVINGGRWGFSPEEQWVYFKEFGSDLKPHVLLWLCEKKENGFPDSYHLKKLTESSLFSSPLLSKSYLINMMHYRYLQQRNEGHEKDVLTLYQALEDFSKEINYQYLFTTFPATRIEGRGNRLNFLLLKDEDQLSLSDMKTPLGHRRLAQILFECITHKKIK